ncbi:MAG: M3 family oligoendopeptidase [Paenibacillaceae bacterium]
MLDSLNQSWQLEMFPGGSTSPLFADHITRLQTELVQLTSVLTAERISVDDENGWQSLLASIQSITGALREADSFVSCVNAQDQNDEEAQKLTGIIKSLYADYASAMNYWEDWFLTINDQQWKQLCQYDFIRSVEYPLQERRELAKDKLPPVMETLINELAVDGYHGWGEHYNTVVRHIVITYEDEHGIKQDWSAGQAANQLHHADRAVREKVFGLWEQAWAEQADHCADTLNHLAGFRLGVYKRRGWNSILKEPLSMNRMSEQTLNVMWEVIEANKQPFIEYLRRKAQLLGVERLNWHDVDAPLESVQSSYSFETAAELITEQFGVFSKDMAEFATSAFKQRWIEAEDRPGKRPGGFCTSFPMSKETRIFMTYAGTASNVSTLAHELGHAYHQHVMNDLPVLTQDYAMNVAETASTFAELIVADATVRAAKTDQERISLLEDKIQRSVAFYMNIHARFLFENEFYRKRQEGLVSAKQLNELMIQAQKEAYCDELAEYHPHFWAAKLHFYLTDVPFYNFPYTFGYMFSAGLYAKSIEEGSGFAEKYVALLRDTGIMTVEQLASKHLGIDLTTPDFWQAAVDQTVEDVTLFLQLTE